MYGLWFEDLESLLEYLQGTYTKDPKNYIPGVGWAWTQGSAEGLVRHVLTLIMGWFWAEETCSESDMERRKWKSRGERLISQRWFFVFRYGMVPTGFLRPWWDMEHTSLQRPCWLKRVWMNSYQTGMDELLSDILQTLYHIISYYIILYPHEKYWNIAPFLVDFPQPCYRNGKPTGLRTFSLPLRWHKEPWDKRDVDDFVKPEMEKSHLQSCSYEYWAHIYIYIYII